MANTKLPARLLDTSAIPALNVTGDLTVDTTTLKVDSTNNRVGIGSAAPANKLDIKGTVGFEATNSTNRWLAYTYTDNTFRLNYNGSGADEVTILSSGNVGIGTDSPAKLLHLSESADGSKLRITRAGVSEWDFSIGNTSTLTGVGAGALEILPQNSGTANELAIGTAGSAVPLVHITNSQNYFKNNVGIGTDSPGDISLKVHSNDSDDYIAIFKQNHASNLGTVQIDTPSDSNARPSRLDFARGGVNKWKTGMVYGDSSNGWGLSDATGSGTALQQTRFLVQPGGNVGIAKTSLTTWSSGYNALQIGGRSFIGAHSSSDLYLGQNAYFNSGWKYEDSAAASLTQHSGGAITHFVTSAGTADNAITWTTGLHITPTGNVGIGTGSPDTLLELRKDTAGTGYGVYPTLSIRNDDSAGYGAIHFQEGSTQEQELK